MLSNLEFARERRVISASVCTPAIRMVVVEVYRSECTGDLDYLIYQVVGLRCLVVREYIKSHHKGDQPPNSHLSEQELLENGRQLESQFEETDVLIVDAEYGIIASKDQLLESSSNCLRTVCCTWYIDEDEDRLKDVIEDLRKVISNQAVTDV